MKRQILAWAGLALAVLLAGCSHLIPTDRNQGQSVRSAGELAATHSSEVTRQGQSAVSPPMEIRMRGKGNTVELKIEAPKESVQVKEADTQNAAGTDSASGFFKSKTALWFTLIMSGVGIMVLVFAIKYLRRSSPAADQLIQAGDDMMAAVIRKARERAQTTTDPTQQAALNVDIAQMESERGKFKTTRRK